MPLEIQDEIHDALGRPERFIIPTGHYTSVIYLMLIRSRAEQFLDALLRPDRR
jgi:hypothetical protein